MDILSTPVSMKVEDFIHPCVDESGGHSIYCQLKSRAASTVISSSGYFFFKTLTLYPDHGDNDRHQNDHHTMHIRAKSMMLRGRAIIANIKK